jgi:asparagine synthase (glutamine-hydrolysing)
MCGFVSIVLDDPRLLVDAALLRRMAATLEHRGPDDEHVHVQGNVGLAFRRLAIIDPAGGRQPIVNEHGDVVIVTNGEIYNHRDLRAKLEHAHRFGSRSDVETLLHGYEEYGSSVFERAVGMWAAMVVDLRGPEPVVVLSRDRLGLKPLYYARIPTGWVIGSEPKALLAHPEVTREVSGTGLLQYFMQGWVTGSQSMWHGLQRLLPGHTAVIRQGVLTAHRYWDAPIDGLREPASQQELLDWTDRVVRDHLESDVPLGAFLSGGLDSNAVADAMARAKAAGGREASALGSGLVLCTVAFDDARYDESSQARRSAQRLGAVHHVRTLRPDPRDVDGDVAWLFDEPLADNSTIPTLLVSRMAREHVTVALSGDGGDEVFAGYRRQVFDVAEHKARRWLGRFGCRTAGALGAVWPKADWLPRPLRFQSTLQDLGRDPAAAYYASTTQLSRAQALYLLKDELVDALGAYDPLDAWRVHYDRPQHVDPLYRAQYADLHSFLPDRILVKADRASMGASLEARPPLLDHRYVERFIHLPQSEKVRGGRGKYAFREALRARLEPEILDGKKMGFSIPAADWLRGPLAQRVDEAIASLSRDWIDAARAQQLQRAHARGVQDATAQLWSLLVLDAWRRRHAPAALVCGGVT